MSNQPGIDLENRLRVLWELQSRSRECLIYVTSIAEAARKLEHTIDDYPIFSSLFINNARSAFLLASHLTGEDEQSVSVISTANYAKTHRSEFKRYYSEAQHGKSKDELDADIEAMLGE